MKHWYAATLSLFLSGGIMGQNLTPVISNFVLNADIPNGSATLHFDLSDAENDPMEVSVQFSANGGKTYTPLGASIVSGDVGFPVAPGAHTAVCTGLDFSTPGKYAFRIVADDKQPFDIQSLVNQVDSNRLRNDLSFMQGIRHFSSGLAHLNEARDSISNLFQSAGLYFENQQFAFSSITGQNLVGSLSGTSLAEKVVIVDAHYDTVNNAPGADDNGSGTVGMMEIARLLSRYPSKKTQRYIGFDLEESGKIGSTRYATNGILPSESIEGVLNFEMIGYWSDQPNTQTLPTGFDLLFPIEALAVADNQYRGDFLTNVGNANSQSLESLLSTAAQQYVPGLKVITLNVPGNGQVVQDLRRSDHAPFWDHNIKALMLTDGADFRNDCYHDPCDTLENRLNFTFMSNVVKATLATMAQMVEVQHADWASASFEVTSSAAEPAPCGFKVLQDNGLTLKADDCLSGEILVAFYDLKGDLLSSEKMSIQGGGSVQLPVRDLPAGVYALKVTHSKGIFSQKVMIR